VSGLGIADGFRLVDLVESCVSVRNTKKNTTRPIAEMKTQLTRR
jgi:hypothetical protein